MATNNMLMSLQQGRENMENFSVSEGKFSPRGRTRNLGVSLFRPGQQVPHPVVTVDLATGREIFSSALPALTISPAKVWESLGPVHLDATILAGNGLFPESSNAPAAAAFDHLRSRVLHGLAQKGWRRIAVTSPTHGCGKSFVATNLALSLARRPESRTVLLDLDLRRPALADLLGLREAPPLSDFLSGEQPLESVFRRFGRTLALGLNGQPVAAAAEQLHSPDTASAMAAMMEQLDPEVVIADLPPVLAGDDVLALAPMVDAVLLVTDGTRSSPAEIRAAERALEGRIPLLGVVLNRAEERASRSYGYGRG